MYLPDLYIASTVSGSARSVNSASFVVANDNPGRKSIWIFNDSPVVCFLKFGPNATTNDYTFQLPALSFYESTFPCPTGSVSAVSTAGSGSVRVTEIS